MSASAFDLNDPLYHPFYREDQYGALGMKQQSLLEYARLAFLIVFALPVKFTGCLLCISAVWIVCRFSFLLPAERRATALVATCQALVGFCCWSLGFQDRQWMDVKDFEYDAEHAALAKSGPHTSGVIVSNHISWCDILIHLEGHFCSFVARSNTQDTPFIGLIAQHLDCIFVSREFKRKGKRADEPIQGAALQVKKRVESVAKGEAKKDIRPLLLFPEGTTTNGHCLLPFKTGAFLAGAPVQPVVIRYTPRSIQPSWESMSAVRHVGLLLANLRHKVSCSQLPVYVPNKAEQADARLYADNVRAAMLRFGNFQPSESNLVECRAYIALLEGGAPPPHSQAGKALIAGLRLPPTLAKGYFPKLFGDQKSALQLLNGD